MGTDEARLSEPVADALFGAARQAVLRLLYGHPDQRFYQRQIIGELGLGHGSVQRELGRLTRSGIISRAVEGHQTYYQANRECPIFEELRGLIRKTFGVADVLRTGLHPQAKRIRLAFIFGSIAAGKETGESDVDLMLVGDKISLQDIVPALRKAQLELRREVNPSVYRTEEFCRKLADGHHFLTSVVAGPKIFLIGDESELKRLAEIRVGDQAPNKSARDRRSPRRR